MSYRVTVLDIKEKKFHGKVVVYNNHSVISPGYLFRTGPPFEDWTNGFFVNGKNHRFSMELTENLEFKYINIFRYSHGTIVPLEIRTEIVNIIRKKMAKIVGKKVLRIKLPDYKQTRVKRFNKVIAA